MAKISKKLRVYKGSIVVQRYKVEICVWFFFLDKWKKSKLTFLKNYNLHATAISPSAEFKPMILGTKDSCLNLYKW